MNNPKTKYPLDGPFLNPMAFQMLKKFKFSTFQITRINIKNKNKQKLKQMS